MSRQRRELPWEKVEKTYVFDGPRGKETLADLFEKRSQNGTAAYNYRTDDPGMPEREGTSVFYKDERGAIFHTYSTYARGIDMMNTAYHYLDLVPKGRDENPESPQDWVRHHDRYEG